MIEGMLLIAPDHAALWREAGLVQRERGNLRAAIASFEHVLALAGSETESHEAAVLLQTLKAKLQ